VCARAALTSRGLVVCCCGAEKNRLQAKFDQIMKAHQLLTDETAKAKYDAVLRAKEASRQRRSKQSAEQRKAREGAGPRAHRFPSGGPPVAHAQTCHPSDLEEREKESKRVRADGELKAKQMAEEVHPGHAHPGTRRRVSCAPTPTVGPGFLTPRIGFAWRGTPA
jgi:curved DNA-binding protein CbpA